jgi:uncharacterized membrane protein
MEFNRTFLVTGLFIRQAALAQAGRHLVTFQALGLVAVALVVALSRQDQCC